VTRHRTVFAKEAREGDRRFLLAAHIDGVAARRGETLSVTRLSALTTASTGSISPGEGPHATRRWWKRRRGPPTLPLTQICQIS